MTRPARQRSATAPAARPFLKWAGGKTQLLPELTATLPALSESATYHEPFVGSGALFFRLRSTGLVPGRAVLSDLNDDLVGAWRAVRDAPDQLGELLVRLREMHSHEEYYRQRERFNAADSLTSVERAAVLIYLNKAGFNGLYRVNRRGHFNVPVGRQASGPSVPDHEHLRACANALQGVEIETRPFTSVLERARRGDFVYFDPPYVPLSTTSSFTAYAREGFGPDDQRRLRDVFGDLDARGCHVMLSNSGADEVHELYASHHVQTVAARRSINSKATSRGPVTEVIVRTWS